MNRIGRHRKCNSLVQSNEFNCYLLDHVGLSIQALLFHLLGRVILHFHQSLVHLFQFKHNCLARLKFQIAFHFFQTESFRYRSVHFIHSSDTITNHTLLIFQHLYHDNYNYEQNVPHYFCSLQSSYFKLENVASFLCVAVFSDCHFVSMNFEISISTRFGDRLDVPNNNSHLCILHTFRFTWYQNDV